MEARETVSVAIELRRDAEPIEASVCVEGGPPTHVCGWLQLTALLQDAVRRRDGAGQAAAATRQEHDS